MKVLIWILLSAAALVATPDTNITGKWTGTFVITAENGETKDSTAYLDLKQTGSEITGSVGPHEGEQHPITKGKIEGDQIMLESADGGMTITFHLALASDRIKGDVTASGEGRTMKAKLDVGRSK